MTHSTYFLILILKIIITYVSCQNESINIVDKKLRAQLLDSFSPQTLPVVNKSTPLNLKIGILVKQIIAVDERSQQIHVKLWTRMTWKNEFMQWNEDKWSDINNIKLEASSVWTPDITLYNDIHEHQDAGEKKFKKRVTVLSNGMNYWNAPGIFASTCKIDVKYFPFDVQECVLIFGSWEHNADELTLVQDVAPIVTETYQNSSEWDLVTVNVSVNTVKYACCDVPYQDITFKFIIHRRPLYYIFNVILPCVILMVIVLFSFFLPPDSGERIAIVITVLLAFTVFLQMINKSLPRNSDTAPVLSVFYVTIMSESTFSLITTCIVLIAHHKGKERWTRPLPGWIRKLFLEKVAGYVGALRNFKCESHQDGIKNLPNTFHHQDQHGNNNNIDISISKEDSTSTQLLDTSPNSSPMKTFMEKIEPSLHHTDTIQNYKLDSILNELHKITTVVHEHRERDKNELEWRLFSNVLDRLFFLMFCVVFVVSSLTILLPAYYGHNAEDH